MRVELTFEHICRVAGLEGEGTAMVVMEADSLDHAREIGHAMNGLELFACGEYLGRVLAAEETTKDFSNYWPNCEPWDRALQRLSGGRERFGLWPDDAGHRTIGLRELVTARQAT